VLAHFAGDGVAEFGQVLAFGPRNIEEVYDSETDQCGHEFGVAVCFCFLRGVGSPAPASDHRRENLDSLLAPFHKPA
jgi:hypothetical protein